MTESHPPAHSFPGIPVNLHPQGESLSQMKTVSLVKESSFEAIRLVLHAGHEIARHQVDGAISVYCVEGRVAFTTDGETRDLRAGQWLYLRPNQVHSLAAVDDSLLLLTILFP